MAKVTTGTKWKLDRPGNYICKKQILNKQTFLYNDLCIGEEPVLPL